MREIISLVSTLKQLEMPAPLDSFIACQTDTLKKAGFPYQKIADELGLKAKSTAQSVFRRYNKNKSY